MRAVGLTITVTVLLIASVSAVVSGDPPRPGTTDSNLTESEEATLWSRQPSERYISNEEYNDTYGENRTTIHEVANGTDLTFTKPPSTAKQWARYAHGNFPSGDRSTSRYPSTANTKDGRYIRDAHGTIFTVSPSTRAHIAPDDERFYVPTEGQVLAVVDYRLAVPSATATERGNTREQWTIDSHEVTETRLYADEEKIATGPGSHRPAIEYATAGVSNFTFEADIEVSIVQKTVRRNRSVNGTRQIERNVTTEKVTVSDSISVDLYDLRATIHYVEYPNGELGAAIYQTEPWQGYTLEEEGRAEVRGVWRFFTARDTDWDTLVESTSTETRRIDSDTLPVYVHAYPSKLGPRAKPEYGGPTILRTWGQEHASPDEMLPKNVTVDVVTQPYEPTYGVAVRSRTLDPDTVTVHGIVHGTEATLIDSLQEGRSLRESSLSAEIIAENETGVTVLLTLEDAETGDPIVLADDDRVAPIADLERNGSVVVDGQRVKTNATGEAVVHLTEQGVYTARYEPASWLDSYPAYAGDSAVVRWHALGTPAGWLNLFTRAGLLLMPFILTWYAGHRLGTILRWRR